MPATVEYNESFRQKLNEFRDAYAKFFSHQNLQVFGAQQKHPDRPTLEELKRKLYILKKLQEKLNRQAERDLKKLDRSLLKEVEQLDNKVQELQKKLQTQVTQAEDKLDDAEDKLERIKSVHHGKMVVAEKQVHQLEEQAKTLKDDCGKAESKLKGLKKKVDEKKKKEREAYNYYDGWFWNFVSNSRKNEWEASLKDYESTVDVFKRATNSHHKLKASLEAVHTDLEKSRKKLQEVKKAMDHAISQQEEAISASRRAVEEAKHGEVANELKKTKLELAKLKNSPEFQKLHDYAKSKTRLKSINFAKSLLDVQGSNQGNLKVMQASVAAGGLTIPHEVASSSGTMQALLREIENPTKRVAEHMRATLKMVLYTKEN